MKITAKRFDKKLPLPKYEKMAAGFDLYCRKSMVVKPKEIAQVPLNIAMEIPEGYFLMLAPRSSTANRLGLMMPNSIGVIDSFYRGADNEIITLFYNFTDRPVKIKKGDRLVQGIILKHETVQFDESKKLTGGTRKKWVLPKKRK